MSDADRLHHFLESVRRRWFTAHALAVVARAALVASSAGVAGLTLYWLLAPSGAPLVALAACTIAAAVGLAALAVWRAGRRPDDRQVARFIEERAAALPGEEPFEDVLVTAVDRSVSTDSSLCDLLATAASRRLEGLSAAQIVPSRLLRRAAAGAAAALVVLGVVLALAVAPSARAWHAAALLVFPETVRIDVAPGDVRLIAGRPLEIRATVFAGERRVADAAPLLVVSSGGEERAVPMTPAAGGYLFAFESVDRSFTYVVRAGSAGSRTHQVTALVPPRVERIELEYRYPGFTGLEARLERDGGDVYAPAGTRVTLRVHGDKPLASGSLAYGRGSSGALRLHGDRVLETELVLARDDSYRVHLADRDGLEAAHPTEYFIRIMDDRPPDVRVLRPAGDRQITPLEEVTIEARAEDDYGVAALELVYAVPGGRTRVVPLAGSGEAGAVRTGAFLLAAEDLGVKPGDVVTYYARARDVARGKRSTEARSDMYFLEVRPFGEEFVAAQSQAGGGPATAQIDGLIAAQKEIINATWTIERRSAAGRSHDDIDAVARAQAELRARLEQMSARRPGRFFPPLMQVRPAPGARPSSDGLGTASEAMSRALEQLQARRTGDALPHEMAALQALLQVQAEIRRREVMQQQASGSSAGAGRQGQDLSALFDKELQRQQRTNYETRSHIEERAEEEDRGSALDRIRDLARRQEELSRRQQELAERTADAEERKRQRERLTREQVELQQQAEALARDLDRGGSQAPSGRQGGGPQAAGRGGGRGEAGRSDEGRAGGSGRQLQQAAEHMKSAAGDLGRDDAKSAAAGGARAAEALRGLEEALRGDSAEAQRRAAGELQLEAQQIAEEQRRIAAEAGRLDGQSGDAASDARRRLAGEKERLADRTDALQGAASSLATASSRDARQRPGAPSVTEAARELEKGQFGARMRDGARQLREGSRGPGASDAGRSGPSEEQLARGLDRVVELLGGGSMEARRLSGQLDETRAIREKLDALERRIREAEQKVKEGASAAGSGGQPGGLEAARAELQALRDEYARTLKEARGALARLEGAAPQSGAAGGTPERHEWSQADPGTQGFKQDFTGWASLRQDIDVALERTEAAVSARLAREAARDRLNAGGSDRVPESYRALIARYYESLARGRK